MHVKELIELFEIPDDILHSLQVIQDPITAIDLHTQETHEKEIPSFLDYLLNENII